MADLTPGQRISITDGREGTVRFIGKTQFAKGDWIGIELDDDTGKNDGAVQGERYFDCEQGYGMFIRPAAVADVMERKPPAKTTATAKAPANGVPQRGRPQSGIAGSTTTAKRQSLLSSTAGKRQSLSAASPSPAPRPVAASTQRTLTVRRIPVIEYVTSYF